MAAARTIAAEYDRFADIYAVWTETAASTRANLGGSPTTPVGPGSPRRESP